MLNKLIVVLLIGVFGQAGYALESDSEQPATLDADDFEIDFATGVRIYRGNVVFRQGSIKLTCDELVTYLNDNDELDKAICVGNPGRFQQRPEGSKEDMVGSAMKITMDEINNLVILKSQAKVIQGGSTITGRIITYNKLTEKASVKGGGNQGAKSTASSTASEESVASTESEDETAENTRPSLTIQPRKKKTIE